MKLLSKTVLAVYLLILLWLILFKFSRDLFTIFDDPSRNLNLIPFADGTRGTMKEMVYNFIVFVPFGLFISVNLRRANFWQKLGLISIFSIAAEMIQFVLAIGRTDLTDVLINTSGGLVGLTLYALGKKLFSGEKLDKFISVAGAFMLIMFILFMTALFSSGVRFK